MEITLIIEHATYCITSKSTIHYYKDSCNAILASNANKQLAQPRCMYETMQHSYMYMYMSVWAL